MKTNVKIAIIGAIATVLAAVIPVVIYKVINPAGDVSIKNSQNVVTGEINTKGDVIIGGTKTTNIQPLSESQNNEIKQKNEHIYSKQHSAA